MSHIERHGPELPTPEQFRAAWATEGRRLMGTITAEHEGEWRRAMEPSRRTGTSMRSLTSEVLVDPAGTHIEGRVGTLYAPVRYVNEGTGLYGPHHEVIRPVRARALRFPTPGNPGFTLAGRQRSGRAGAGASWVFAKYVRGIRPRRYAQLAAEAVRPRALEIAHTMGARLQARLHGGHAV